jgi:hypothetical protein
MRYFINFIICDLLGIVSSHAFRGSNFFYLYVFFMAAHRRGLDSILDDYLEGIFLKINFLNI